MKICLVHEEYPEETNFGGIATYQKNVAEQLVKMGHTVYVVCRGLKENQNYVENGVNVIRIHVDETDNQINNYVSYREKVKSILLYLQNNNLIDIIEVPDWGAETVLFEDYRTIPLVVRLHTPLKIWLQFNKNDYGPIKDNMLKWEKKMINSADLVTCCSSALKKLVVKDFDIDKSKIIVTSNPGNLKDFKCDKRIKKENKIVFVGSLEQRKGVCVLALALNYVFEKYPNLRIDFIGKDTTRNDKNISTIKRIYEIVLPEYHKNINIVGQIPNSCLNYYLNASLVGVYPSLFDNFPYVVLEAMAAGLHIVGSENSGMVEMLDDESSIYKTGDEYDLAKHIIDKYELSQKEVYSERNIKRVNELYNSEKVCNDLIERYKQTIHDFYRKIVSMGDIQNIIHSVGINEKIISYIKEKNGVANDTYRIIVDNKQYVLKKYNYRYRFDLAKELYNIYEKNGVKVVKPLNSEPILYNHFIYNIFDYVENKNKNIDDNYFVKLLSIDRTCSKTDMLFTKCDEYLKQLRNNYEHDYRINDKIKFVINCYNELKKNLKICGNAINHGDIQLSNIISANDGNYLIDFDEAIVASPIYDFAVIAVKMYMNDELEKEKIKLLIDKIKPYYPNLDTIDYYDMIQLYLCKILLEKYYLHEIKKIDLFSNEQKKDYFVKYDKYLRKILRRNDG